MEVGGAGCKWWSAGAAKKQVGQSRLQVSAVMVPAGAEPVAGISCDAELQVTGGRSQQAEEAGGGAAGSPGRRRRRRKQLAEQVAAEAYAGGRWQVERRSGEGADGTELVAGISFGGARSGCKEPVEVGGAVERS